MSTKEKIIDPVFGRLDLDIFWEGKVDLPEFGRGVQITVNPHGKNKPPAEYQRQIFQEFVRACNPSLIERMKDAVYEGYMARRKSRALEKSFDVSQIAHADDAWRLLKLAKISIPWQLEPHRKCFSILWKAPWLRDELVSVSYWERGELTWSRDGEVFDHMAASGTDYRS